MDAIKVNFGYFWPGFNPDDNIFTRLLSKRRRVEVSDDPDLFFFTHAYNGKRDYLRYKCHRVFLGWENMRADWSAADYVLDSDFDDRNPRHKRYPIWASWNVEKLTKEKDVSQFLNKSKFACMVVSNAKAKERISFFNELSKYKRVDSGGRYLNNVGGPVANKMEFIKDYKFVISFENSSYPGYTTEKLIEPMFVNSIPIYWGNEAVGQDFNLKSFVHVNQFKSFKDAVEYIVYLDREEEKYFEMAKQPWFANNQVPEEFSQSSIEEFFDFVLDDMLSKTPVAKSKTKSMIHGLKLAKSKFATSLYTRMGIEVGFR